MESKRQLQVGELLKRNFSLVLQDHGVNIYKGILVSVTQVKTTPDLSLAKIYISVYGVQDKESVVGLLYEHHSFLKSELVKRIRKHVRRIPEIDFYIDDTLDEMYKIDELLTSIKK
ncbi:MAG TPA: 30S ribosome-binding factor RbfA [Saprospiraceae bacterium]|nr:30S ribosome-binding factor RbfA [Saprospiraceae bacterium]